MEKDENPAVSGAAVARRSPVKVEAQLDAIEEILLHTDWEMSTPPWVPVSALSRIAQANAAMPDFPISAVPQTGVTIARDHLVHAVLILRGDSESLGVPCSLLRSALETAANGLWVLMPEDETELLERVLRWHYDNLREAAKLSPLGFQVAIETVERMVTSAAKSNGIDPKVVLRTLRMEEVLPTVDPLPADDNSMSLTDMWRLASGFAHGKQWAYHVLAEKGDKKRFTDGSTIREVRTSRGFQANLATDVTDILVPFIVRWHALSQP